MIRDGHKMLNLSKFVNITDLNDDNVVDIFSYIFDSSYGDSWTYLTIFLCVLLICSIIGSIANLFFICIFTLIFNKNFNQKIHTKLTTDAHRLTEFRSQLTSLVHKTTPSPNKSSANEINLISLVTDVQVVTNNDHNNKTIKLYEDYAKLKNKLALNSNLKVFYSLIYYLAFVDSFTCLLAVPVTVYEIKNNLILNEFCCKLFEFMRSTGVIFSNFIIILIVIEQYKSLSAVGMVSKKFFYIRLFLVLFFSILIGTLSTLQVSVYQRAGDLLLFTGRCLKSEQIINFKLTEIINILTTSIFIVGSVFVAFVYSLIFKKTFELNERHTKRKTNEKNMLNRARFNSKRLKKRKSSTIERKSCPFYQKPNFRIAVMILVVTFVYYISIIPWCLTLNGIIEYNPYIHYAFLLKSVFNPFIYGMLNPNLRNCGFNLLKLFFISLFKKTQ
jgi:hypothetical protein